MPKQMFTLNNFSGGLNTKSSTRDINQDQVSKAENVVISNPGLIVSSSVSTDKSATNISKVSTSNYGNGAFIFNSEYDISDDDTTTQVAKQIIAYPDGANLEFYHRGFNTTGNFLDAAGSNDFAMTSGSLFEPVYYFVDGRLYVSDKDNVDSDITKAPQVLEVINTKRFNADILEWESGDAAVTAPTDAVFAQIKTDASAPTNATINDAGDFSITLSTHPSYDNTATTNGGTLTADVGIKDTIIHVTDSDHADFVIGNVFLLNDEPMQLLSADSTANTLNVLRNAYGDAPPGGMGVQGMEHKTGDIFKGFQVSSGEQLDDVIISGGWPSGQYEFTYSFVNYSGDESLMNVNPQATTALMSTGEYFSDVRVVVNVESAFRKREKGFRIYTRLKGSNDRYGLFLDCDYEKGVRPNMFEDYVSWTAGSGDSYGGGDQEFFEIAAADALTIANPSLDTYESINGYSEDEESISFGTKGGYKAATVCSRRAWVANVKRDSVVYNDRIYYTPVNRFATFPESFYLDIGVNDGDSFTALHSIGNRLLAFKQKKLYVINVSSSADAGWYLEAEYEGVGCRTQESVTKTPFGICWVNDDGVYLYEGEGTPQELTVFLDDAIWRTSAGTRPTIGFNNKYKQLCVVQDTTQTNDILIFDFTSKSWSTTKSMLNGMSNFVQTSDGLYFIEYASSGNNKTVKLLSGDTGTKQIKLQTKDIDFGSPGKVKKVYKVYITAKDDGGSSADGNTLTLKYALNGNTTFGNASTATPNSSTFTTLVYTLNVDCESIAFELTDEDGEAITINDITVEYRAKYKRAS